MKPLKFTPDLVQLILSGKKTSTWRFFDDKNLQKNDKLVLINKETGQEFAYAIITDVREKEFNDIGEEDFDGHESYINRDEMLEAFRKYYGSKVTPKSIVKVVRFELVKCGTESDKISISKATSADAEGIQVLTSEASKGMYELCGWSAQEIAQHFSPEKMKDGADRLKKAIPNFTEADILFVAKDITGKIVGCCFAEKQESKNIIEAVYVLPDFQGLGLSKQLFDRAFGLLNPNNNTFLDVFSLNLKAVNFYKKLGFSETGKKTFDKKYVNSKGDALEITEMVLSGKN